MALLLAMLLLFSALPAATEEGQPADARESEASGESIRIVVVVTEDPSAQERPADRERTAPAPEHAAETAAEPAVASEHAAREASSVAGDSAPAEERTPAEEPDREQTEKPEPVNGSTGEQIRESLTENKESGVSAATAEAGQVPAAETGTMEEAEPEPAARTEAAEREEAEPERPTEPEQEEPAAETVQATAPEEEETRNDDMTEEPEPAQEAEQVTELVNEPVSQNEEAEEAATAETEPQPEEAEQAEEFTAEPIPEAMQSEEESPETVTELGDEQEPSAEAAAEQGSEQTEKPEQTAGQTFEKTAGNPVNAGGKQGETSYLSGQIAVSETERGIYTAQFTIETYDSRSGRYKPISYTVTGFKDAAAAEKYARSLAAGGAGTPVALQDGSLVDAEKLKDTSVDSNLCWAATCADMLIVSGWAEAPERAEFADEDALFDYYTEKFTNLAGLTTAGITWFFEGVNLTQRTGGATHLVEGETIKDAYLPEYCADDFLTTYDLRYTDDLTAALGSLIGDADGDACALGLTIGYYDQDLLYRRSGHAVSIAGYATDESGAYTQIILADPDNSCRNGGTDRTVYPNTYTAYSIVQNGGSWQLIDYSSSDRYAILLDAIYTLKYYTDRTASIKEEGGTMNAIENSDIAVQDVEILNGKNKVVSKVRSGETVKAQVTLENHGAMNYKADAPVTFILYKDGKEYARLETTTGEMNLRTIYQYDFIQKIAGKKKALKPGEYSLSVIIDPEHTVTEAYYNNNTSKQMLFTVLPKLLHKTSVVKILIVPENDGAYEEAKQKTYKVEIYNAPSAVNAVIYHAPAVSPDTGSARNVLTGNECRILSGGKGRYTLEFTESFLKELPEGACKFELSIGGETYYFTYTVSR